MLDTNILVYAFDARAGEKHRIATECVDRLTESENLVLSIQAIHEFYHTATRPHKMAMPHVAAMAIVSKLVQSAELLPITPGVTFRALDAIPRHGLSFWDALIWAAARENGIGTIYTEDFQHGRDVEGVRFVNPFAAIDP